MDILFHPKAKVFDLAQDAGYLLAIQAILQGKFEELLAAFGVCCSSWILTSRGSSHRSELTPMGNPEFAKVKLANLLGSRTVLLLLLVAAVSGVWVVEQPSTSMLFSHDRFRWLVDSLEKLKMRVFSQTFWMRSWGHPTAKRTVAFSNSALIGGLNAGSLKRQQLQSDVKTTRKYTTKEGRKGFSGTIFDVAWKYAAKIVQIGEDAKFEKRDPVPAVEDLTKDTIDAYAQLEWGDSWDDAQLVSVIKYARASKLLWLPECWRQVLPKR
ncbi:unnamed protein product, partial [Effrenium voratum]